MCVHDGSIWIVTHANRVVWGFNVGFGFYIQLYPNPSGESFFPIAACTRENGLMYIIIWCPCTTRHNFYLYVCVCVGSTTENTTYLFYAHTTRQRTPWIWIALLPFFDHAKTWSCWEIIPRVGEGPRPNSSYMVIGPADKNVHIVNNILYEASILCVHLPAHYKNFSNFGASNSQSFGDHSEPIPKRNFNDRALESFKYRMVKLKKR